MLARVLGRRRSALFACRATRHLPRVNDLNESAVSKRCPSELRVALAHAVSLRVAAGVVRASGDHACISGRRGAAGHTGSPSVG